MKPHTCKRRPAFPALIGAMVCSLLFIAPGAANAVVTWKGASVGGWNVLSNWAGGLPNISSTVKLNHDRQINAYTVVVQTAAETDKLWLQSFGDVPIHVRINSGGLLNLNMLRMGDKAEDRISSFTIDGGSVHGRATLGDTANTSFLIGNNPNGTASLVITNSGSMTLEGSNGLTVASRAGSTGSVHVAGSALQIKESMIIAQGAGSCGKLILSGLSSVSITGALHIAKLDNGAISPTGHVQVTSGLLECGTLNVGAAGNGSMTLDGGEVRVFGGGAELGKDHSTGLLTMNGGIFSTIGSPLNIGHTDSSGTFVMNEGSALVDGCVTAGSSSRSFGRIELSGGSIIAKGLVVGGAVSSSGEITMTDGTLDCGAVLQVGALGPGTLKMHGGLLVTTNLMIGAAASGECSLLNGELLILGTSVASMQITNGTVLLEKALLQWGNPTVTEAITNAVAGGALTWTNGLPTGTYSTNGFDGRLIMGQDVLYWDNLDNGSQFPQSGIWVEHLPETSPYEDWASEYNLLNNTAEPSADPDSDGLDNLTEYGLGGNPTNGNDIGILPTFGWMKGDAINGFEYVYRQRSDADAPGLGYYLELNTNLAAGIWMKSGYDVIGTSANEDGFVMMTNHISEIHFPTLFIRLRIQIE